MTSQTSTLTVGKHKVSKVAAYALLGVIGAAAMSQPALAQSVGDPTGVVQAVIDVIMGGFGKATAVLAVCVVGFMCLSGRLNMGYLFAVVCGIALIFGSAWGVDQLSGGA